MDDHLFPYRASVGVLQVMHFIEHNPSKGVKTRGTGIDHVSQNFGRHDDDRSVAVDGGISSQKAD